MLIDLTQRELDHISAALLSYSTHWGSREAERQYGRVACMFLGNMSDEIRAKLMGQHLPLPAPISAPPAPAAPRPPQTPSGGLKVRSEPPKPVLPPSGERVNLHAAREAVHKQAELLWQEREAHLSQLRNPLIESGRDNPDIDF